MGITEANIVTLDNITRLGNSTNVLELAIKVNNYVYDGWLFFLLIMVVWVIMFMVLQRTRDQPLNNLMYSGAVLSVVSLFFRVAYMSIYGVSQGLITDFQLWIFPIITAILATIIWKTSN